MQKSVLRQQELLSTIVGPEHEVASHVTNQLRTKEFSNWQQKLQTYTDAASFHMS